MTLRVEARGLTRSYGGRIALAPTDLAVEPGEALGLLGPNGAGKSTLLALCAGLRAPSGGAILLGGRPARDREARRGVGVLPERARLPAGHTLRALLRARAGGPSGPVVEALGLGGLTERPVGTLSAGQRQRAALALALHGGGRLLVLDEPLTALDRDSERRVVELVRARKAAGCTILLATHRPEAWIEVLDRVATVADGVIAPPQRTAEALERAGRAGLALVGGRLVDADPGALVQVRLGWGAGDRPAAPPAAAAGGASAGGEGPGGAGARLGLAVRDAAADGALPAALLAAGLLAAGLPLARAAAMGAPTRASLDLVLWWTWLVGCAVAMWIGTRAVAAPLQDRTALWALTGPLSAGRWALERLLAGGAVAASAYLGLLAAGLALHGAIPQGLPGLATLVLAEIAMLVALSGLLGALYPPLAALALVGAVWLVGHLAGVWLDVLAVDGREGLGRMALAALPDLDLLDVHREVLDGERVGLGRVVRALGWAAAWTGAALAGTVAVLERRDLA